MAAGLHIGFELDRRWHSLRGEMEQSKRLQDLADAQGLLEGDASLLQHLSQRERELLATLPP